MKVIGAKVKDEIYNSFQELAKAKDLTQSELLRHAIHYCLKGQVKIEKRNELIYILQENWKILDRIRKLINTSSDSWPRIRQKILELIDREIQCWDRKIDYEKTRASKFY